MEELILTNENGVVTIHNLSQKAFQSHNKFPDGVMHGCRYNLTVRQIGEMLILYFDVDVAEANRIINEIGRAMGSQKMCIPKFIVDVYAENDPAHMDIHINN